MAEEISGSDQAFHGVEKIVSGGQTGVDQAALDVAIELSIPHGGWCPKGRLSESGRISSKYQLKELPTVDYAARTEKNVIDSDGTLILFRERLRGGTALTYRYAKEYGKPVLRVRLDAKVDYTRIVQWLRKYKISVLNVAGPRSSSHPDLYGLARELLLELARYSRSDDQQQLF